MGYGLLVNGDGLLVIRDWLLVIVLRASRANRGGAWRRGGEARFRQLVENLAFAAEALRGRETDGRLRTPCQNVCDVAFARRRTLPAPAGSRGLENRVLNRSFAGYRDRGRLVTSVSHIRRALVVFDVATSGVSIALDHLAER